ncbi:MAG: DUF104 domain-containing protein [Spirochaetes bacterium]|nr:DUF104 domain-containing protein [Spirochaetota bacterium]
MIATGHIENNSIILDEKINIPEGVKVRISVTPLAKEVSSNLCGIWKDNRSSSQIVEDIMSARTSSREV